MQSRAKSGSISVLSSEGTASRQQTKLGSCVATGHSSSDDEPESAAEVDWYCPSVVAGVVDQRSGVLSETFLDGSLTDAPATVDDDEEEVELDPQAQFAHAPDLAEEEHGIVYDRDKYECNEGEGSEGVE